MEVLGKAKGYNIIRKCDCCQKEFIMTCEDYIFNNCGQIIRNDEEIVPGWVCETCKEHIIKIKNL